MSWRGWLVLAWLGLALAWPAAAQDYAPSGGGFGGVGLLETRTARMREDGSLEAGAALRRQREFYFLTVQGLPFLEATFRLANRLNGTAGHGHAIDRAFDAKLRLLREGDWWPALAVGVQDAIGTGIYGGEYLVASKRFWAVDVSLGLGWGRLGSAADLPNLPLLGNRSRNVGQGGTPALGSYFRGRDVALFGGVEWHMPPLLGVAGLRGKLEFSGDALRDERGGWPGRDLRSGLLRGRAASRVNAGLQWQDEHVDVGAYFLHGTDALLRVSLRFNAAAPPMLPVVTLLAMPARPAVVEAEPVADGREAALAALRRAGFRPLGFAVQGAEARVQVTGGRFRRLSQVAGRVARALQPVLPPQVETLRVEWRRQGAVLARLVVLRQAMEAGSQGQGSAEEVLASARLEPAAEVGWPERAKLDAPSLAIPWLDWGVAPRLPVQLGDPRTGARWQLALAAGARVDLGAGVALAGSVSQAVLGNLAGGLPSNSVLPHVRSDVGRYARRGTSSMPALYAERIWNPAPDVFGRVTAGLLEPMFAGVSAEGLWRPVGQRLALGVDMNWVRQRDYGQRCALRRDQVMTGHASAYAELPWFGLFGVLRAGRYLAGDWGATVELGRRFDNGIEVGGFATVTTVPARRFGEGSFDKGIYLRIPLEVFGPETTAQAGTTLRPVARDGGQRLGVDNPLWEVAREGRAEALGRGYMGFLR